jgi:hypothetical protein
MRSPFFPRLVLCLVAALAVHLAAVGCGNKVQSSGGGGGGSGGSGRGGAGGGDDCTRARAHLDACAPPGSSSSSASSSGVPFTCAGALLCQSQCINNSTCPEINGLAPSFIACLQACQGK